MTHSTDHHLSSFIAHAREKGMDAQTIRMLLLSNGWKEKDIAEGLASSALTMPVPLPPDAGSARDTFFHLLTLVTLTSTVSALIYLFFQYWNRLLPDEAFDYYYINDFTGIRWSMAVILVSFPLLLWMSRLLTREYRKSPEKLGGAARRWITYLILFVTACTLIGDLITLLFYLLEGDVTLRFLLKVITILVLCGLPFLYFLHAMRLSPENYSRSSLHKQFLWVGSAIVAVAFIWGIITVGSPMYGRSQRFDEVRLSDLRAIHTEIINIVYDGKPYEPSVEPSKPLPASLQEAAKQAMYQKLSIADPETGTPYVYRPVTGGHTYQLCASFVTVRDQEYDIFWNHPVGEHCFELDATNTTVR